MIKRLPTGALCRIPIWYAGGLLFCFYPHELQTAPRSEPKCSCGLGENIVETMNPEFVEFLGDAYRTVLVKNYVFWVKETSENDSEINTMLGELGKEIQIPDPDSQTFNEQYASWEET